MMCGCRPQDRAVRKKRATLQREQNTRIYLEKLREEAEKERRCNMIKKIGVLGVAVIGCIYARFK